MANCPLPVVSSSVFPSPYRLAHIKRVTTTQLDPNTGNPTIAEAPPVIRYAQSISQIGRLKGSSKFVLTPEFVKRIDTDLHITVDNPDLYGPLDQVLLFPDIDDDGEYVAGTGVAFWVDGLPIDARESPWPLFTSMFGGLVRIKRVT